MSFPAVSWNDLNANAEFLHLPPAAIQKLQFFFQTLPPDMFRDCAAKVFSGFPMEKVRARFPEGKGLEQFLLLCIIANCGAMQELYAKEQYPAQMLEEISHDLTVWLDTLERDLNGYGLIPRIFFWEKNCFCGVVKQFGRLQAETVQTFGIRQSIYRKNGAWERCPAFKKGNPLHPDLTFGDKIILFHIPASGPMTIPGCIASFRRMRDFVKEFQPDYDWKAIVSYSWIFDSKFAEILGPDSNIVRLQKLGHVFPMPETNETKEIIWRIWGKAGSNMPVEQLPARTSMERGVKQAILQGYRFQEGCFVLFPDELESL